MVFLRVFIISNKVNHTSVKMTNDTQAPLPTCECDKDGGSVDHTHMTIEGGPVESLSGEVNRGDGERGIVGDGNS